MEASMNTEGNASDMDISSEDSEDMLDEDLDDSDIYGSNMDGQPRDSIQIEVKKNNGGLPQQMNKINKVKPTSTQELINISSSDDEDQKNSAPKPPPSKEEGGKGMPAFPIKFPFPVPRRNTVTIIRKRNQPADAVPSVSFFKRRRVDRTLVPTSRLSHFIGSEQVIKSICELVLHLKHAEIYRKLGVAPPRGFLLHGPPGTGKTLLAHAIAGELDIPLVKVGGPELVGPMSGESEMRVRDLFEQAKAAIPCVLFIDEIDCITPRRDTAQKDMERRIVSQLLTSLDQLSETTEYDQLLVVGATNRPDSVDPALRRAGRFDMEVCLGMPDTKTRAGILRLFCHSLRLGSSVSVDRLALQCPGYVGADLKALVSRAAITAVTRIMESTKKKKEILLIKKSENLMMKIPENMETETPTRTEGESVKEGIEEKSGAEEGEKKEEEEKKTEEGEEKAAEEEEIDVTTVPSTETLLRNSRELTEEELEGLYIEEEDFAVALKTVQPSAKREGFATVPDVTWDDVGSLTDIRHQLKMSIMMPVKYPEQFARLGVSSPTGILLCGPPGCGKTLLAKAVANEANINFISVKGPELLNMYVGESERAVRQCFQRARNSQPCVIFFDELDALCPKRSDSIEGSASSRVVNQLLTEMDGVEGRAGVFLMAATNRPDMVDPAVMRPGRFDKLLYVGLPSAHDRADILRALTKNGTRPEMGGDVDLGALASDARCEGYTGADLAALVKEASVQCLTAAMASPQGLDGPLVVSAAHFASALASIRPSVSDKERKRYEALRLQYTAPGPQA